MDGLNAVDKAQEWYLKQISVVQDKIKNLGRMGTHVVNYSCNCFLTDRFFFNFFNIKF